MTVFIFLPAFGFLLFVLGCWSAALLFLRSHKKVAALAAFVTPLIFLVIIFTSHSDLAILLRITLFDLWFREPAIVT